MQLQIFYNELESLIQQHYNQVVRVAYVNENTLCISKGFKCLCIHKNVSIRLTLLQIQGTDIILAYKVNSGINLLIKGALAWFKDSMDRMVEKQEGSNCLVLHLSAIKQIENVLRSVDIQSLTFEKECINGCFNLKTII